MHSISAYRNIVEKMLHVPQTLENIITAASSLDGDPVVIGSSFQSIPGTWRWQNIGTTPKLSLQHKAFHSLVTTGQCVKWDQNVMLIIKLPPNDKWHYTGIEAINQLAEFRQKTSNNLRENVLPACVSDSNSKLASAQTKNGTQGFHKEHPNPRSKTAVEPIPKPYMVRHHKLGWQGSKRLKVPCHPFASITTPPQDSP